MNPPCTPGVDCPCPGDDCFVIGQHCSYTQGGYGASGGNGNGPGTILAGAFPTAYPSGVTIGGGFTGTWTSAPAIQGSGTGQNKIPGYLPAGGTAGVFTGTTVNATSTSAGVFGGQVLALKLNLDLASLSPAVFSASGIGGLYLVGTGTSLDGLTVAQILAAANTAIGGGVAPISISAFNDVVTNLNESFDNCAAPSLWTTQHLTPTNPAQ